MQPRTWRRLPSLRAGLFLGEELMSRMPWSDFLQRQSKAHLVVGELVEFTDSKYGDELAAVQYVLKRLASNQKRSGDYTASVARDGVRPELYFAFDNEADARKFAGVLAAEASNKYPGWASQRAFEIDGARFRELKTSLPARRRQPKQSVSDRWRLQIPVERGPSGSATTRSDREACHRAILPLPGMWSRSATPQGHLCCLREPAGQPKSATWLYRRFCAWWA
jgi:hypothetical protein